MSKKKAKKELRSMEKVLLMKPFYFIMNYNSNKSVRQNAIDSKLAKWYSYQLVKLLKKHGILNGKRELTKLGSELQDRFNKMHDRFIKLNKKIS